MSDCIWQFFKIKYIMNNVLDYSDLYYNVVRPVICEGWYFNQIWKSLAWPCHCGIKLVLDFLSFFAVFSDIYNTMLMIRYPINHDSEEWYQLIVTARSLSNSHHNPYITASYNPAIKMDETDVVTYRPWTDMFIPRFVYIETWIQTKKSG